MFKPLALICSFLLLSQSAFSQCPVESNTCQTNSPCVSIDFASTTILENNGDCEVTVVVDLAQGNGGGSTIKKLRIGVVGLAGDGVKLCEEFTDIANNTTSISHTFVFPGACITHDPIDIIVEGYTCENNNNCCCGRQAGTSLDVLPVKLTSFIGFPDKNENVLNWATEKEDNTLLFSIHKSIDGRSDFISLGDVLAAGFSESPKQYGFRDVNPNRTNYYRLKILDFDGTVEYSPIIAVDRADRTFSLVDIFPVPATDRTTVVIQSENEGRAEIILYNLQGQKVLYQNRNLVEGVNRLELEWENSKESMYFLTVYNGKEWINQKITLVNIN